MEGAETKVCAGEVIVFYLQYSSAKCGAVHATTTTRLCLSEQITPQTACCSNKTVCRVELDCPPLTRYTVLQLQYNNAVGYYIIVWSFRIKPTRHSTSLSQIYFKLAYLGLFNTANPNITLIKSIFSVF